MQMTYATGSKDRLCNNSLHTAVHVLLNPSTLLIYVKFGRHTPRQPSQKERCTRTPPDAGTQEPVRDRGKSRWPDDHDYDALRHCLCFSPRAGLNAKILSDRRCTRIKAPATRQSGDVP